MRIITPDKLVKTEGFFFKPLSRYIISDYELDYLIRGAPHTNFKWSSFNAHERRYDGSDINGKKVCIYRHNAWGDQLIVSAVPRYLKTLYPDSTIHLYCHPKVMPLWLGNPFVEGCAVSLPIPYEAAMRYDYHIFYEGMLEGNSEYDQNCCYDDFFHVIGLHDVPDHFKRPYFESRPEDYACVRDWGIDLTSAPYMVYHMAPDNENRSYPPEKSVEFMEGFLEEFNQMRILIVGVDKHKQYSKILSNLELHPRVENLIDKTPDFRGMFPILERASLVVCPDSSVMHMAACFDHVPVVSLWGLFAPQDRIKYYPNSHPIFPKDVCQYAPCRDHNFRLPVVNCKDATEHGDMERIKWCAVLDAITPEEILNKCVEVL